MEAGNDRQIIIKSLVESMGMRITVSSVPRVSSLEFIYDKYGYENLSRTLALLIGTWEGDPQSLYAEMIKGLSRFLDIFREEIDDEMFKGRMCRSSVKEIVRNAKERRTGSLGFVEALLIAYNKRTRYPLMWDKLYAVKPKKSSSNDEPAESDDNNAPEGDEGDLGDVVSGMDGKAN